MKKYLNYKKSFIRINISIIAALLFLHACNGVTNNLHPYKTLLVQDDIHKGDSIKAFGIEYYSTDSFSIKRLLLTKDSVFVLYSNQYTKKSDGFYEYKKYDSYSNDTVKIVVDTVKIFGHTDTSFIYSVNNDALIPIGIDNYKYIIKEIDKNRFLTMQINMADTVCKRTYYYDDNYQITKIVYEDRNISYTCEQK